MAALTKNVKRQTTFPTTGYTTEVFAVAGRYYKGAFLACAAGGGDVGPATNKDEQFAGICQSDIEITAEMVTAGTNKIDVMQGMLFWYKNATLAVKANQYKSVDAADTGDLALSSASKTRVGKIVGIDTVKGELFIDATATGSRAR